MFEVLGTVIAILVYQVHENLSWGDKWLLL